MKKMLHLVQCMIMASTDTKPKAASKPQTY